LAGGPKIFRPSPLQCEALEHAEARIEVIQAEECSVGPGTQGKIVKVVDLGSNMVQIDALTDDGQKFSLIAPPDEFKTL
jgi:hypothetical protein